VRYKLLFTLSHQIKENMDSGPAGEAAGSTCCMGNGHTCGLWHWPWL